MHFTTHTPFPSPPHRPRLVRVPQEPAVVRRRPELVPQLLRRPLRPPLTTPAHTAPAANSTTIEVEAIRPESVREVATVTSGYCTFLSDRLRSHHVGNAPSSPPLLPNRDSNARLEWGLGSAIAATATSSTTGSACTVRSRCRLVADRCGGGGVRCPERPDRTGGWRGGGGGVCPARHVDKDLRRGGPGVAGKMPRGSRELQLNRSLLAKSRFRLCRVSKAQNPWGMRLESIEELDGC